MSQEATMAWALFAFSVVFAGAALLTGEIKDKNTQKVTRRSQNPAGYWLRIGFCIVISVLFSGFALRYTFWN